MKVRNPSGSEVKFDLYGYGKIAVPAGEVADIPEAVWNALQDPNLWGGRKCPLEIYVPPKKEKEPKEDGEKEEPKGGKGGKK